MMTTYTLSFHTTHNSGATILKNEEIIAAASEERFNRIKHFASLPYQSIEYCLNEAGINPGEVDQIVVPSDVVTWGAKLLLNREEYEAENISQGSKLLTTTVKKWMAERIRWTKNTTSMPKYARIVEFPDDIELFTVNHHESHAASAFYTSGFSDALVFTSDGLGDGLSLTVWRGTDSELKKLYQAGKDGSFGWFYGVVTQALGWWVGNGEGKTMGLASYGETKDEVIEELRAICPEFEQGELTKSANIAPADAWRSKDTYHWNFEEVKLVERLLNRYKREDVAAAAQYLLEEQLSDLVNDWLKRTGTNNLAVAGGVFLNVALNRRILTELDIDGFHAFPAAGDDGLPVGAALSAVHAQGSDSQPKELSHPDLGPGFTGEEIKSVLEGRKLGYEQPESVADAVAELLLDGSIVAWFQGRMEYGPRALGNRSILIDPRLDDGKDRVNAEIKFRESWRPFAPSVLEEAIEDYFVDPAPDTFMITSFRVRDEKRNEIPAVTHVDGTSRPQVVKRDAVPQYYDLIKTFDEKGGVPILLNTSFNLSGDPIVCSIEDAIYTFYNCGLDALAIGPYLLRKESITRNSD